MIWWLLKATFGTLVFAAVGYVVVAVPIGRRTLFEHGVEIARTQPAQELAEDVAQAASQTADRMRAKLDEGE